MIPDVPHLLCGLAPRIGTIGIRLTEDERREASRALAADPAVYDERDQILLGTWRRMRPIGMQYAAEITNPTPAGTSNGLVQLCGQVSVAYVYLMAALRTADGSYTVSLVLSAVLLALGVLVVSRLKDAPAA